MDLLYFDHAATTPVKPEVLKEMLPYFSQNFGNASSIYSVGIFSSDGFFCTVAVTDQAGFVFVFQ